MIAARNLVGFGANSTEIIIRAAAIPLIPSSVSTYVKDGYTTISWTAEYNGGSEIIADSILIMQSDG